MISEILFFTIDDLRATVSERSRIIHYYDAPHEAITSYAAMPEDKVRTLGMCWNGLIQTYLVQRHPVPYNGIVWEDVLVAKFKKTKHLWDDPLVRAVINDVCKRLSITKEISENRIIDISEDCESEPLYADKRLLFPEENDPMTTFVSIYIAGAGWLSESQFREQFTQIGLSPSYPYVKAYLINRISPDGEKEQAVVRPHEFDALVARLVRRGE